MPSYYCTNSKCKAQIFTSREFKNFVVCPACGVGELERVYGIESSDPRMITEPIVLSGKAKDVFAEIERRTLEAQRAYENLTGERVMLCPFDHQAKCTKPYGVSCKYIDCPVWKERFPSG